MVDLPEVVWEQVARWLHDEEVFALMSLNRAFYNIALDRRYGEVWWTRSDKKTIRSMERLGDPSVASRVRRLHISSWFIEYLINRELLVSSSRRGYMMKQWFAELFKPVLRGMKRSSQERRGPSKLRPIAEIKAPTSSKEVLCLMVKAVGGMVNLTEYEFRWKDLPLTIDTKRFLTTSGNAFGKSLRKLALNAPLSMFQHILTLSNFVGLEELELQYDFDILVKGDVVRCNTSENIAARNETILVDFVAPFINNMRTSLQRLTISSSLAKGDHSQFFHSLGSFPRLHRLALRIPFENQLADPSGFWRILCSPTLLDVELKPDRSYNGGEHGVGSPSGKSWFIINQEHLSLSGVLESLTIPVLDLKMTVSLINRSARSLTSLCLLDRYLELDEVVTIVNAFTDWPWQLNYLSIEITRLSPHLFDILSIRLPGLRSLTLILKKPDVYQEYNYNLDWKLLDISIFIECYRDDGSSSWYEDRIMCLISRSIPSIRSFKGRILQAYP